MEKHSPWYIINHGHDFGKLFVPVSGNTAKFSVHCCVCAPEERSGCYVISIHCCPCTACVTVLYTCAPAFNKYALLKSSSPCKNMVIYCDVILRDLGKSPYPTVIFKQLASLFTFYTLTADKSKFLFSKNKIGSRNFRGNWKDIVFLLTYQTTISESHKVRTRAFRKVLFENVLQFEG